MLSGAFCAALATASSAAGLFSTCGESETLESLRSNLEAGNPVPTFWWCAGRLLQQLQLRFRGMTYYYSNEIYISLMSKAPRVAG